MRTFLKLGLTIIFSLFFQLAFAQYASITRYKINSSRKKVKKVDFTEWSTLLRRNTSVLGTINYSGFNKDKESFNNFIEELSTIKITNAWTQDERKAYWINVYNAFSIKLITDHFPLRNISEIEKPFKKKFFEINREMMSLNDVEKILKTFNDPRILIVLNRNSMSGVRLIKRAYDPNKLNEMLDKRVRLFINNPKKNIITSSEVKLSSLLKVYEKEILESHGSLENFINLYSDVNITGKKKSYMEFDETVNSYQIYGE